MTSLKTFRLLDTITQFSYCFKIAHRSHTILVCNAHSSWSNFKVICFLLKARLFARSQWWQSVCTRRQAQRGSDGECHGKGCECVCQRVPAQSLIWIFSAETPVHYSRTGPVFSLQELWWGALHRYCIYVRHVWLNVFGEISVWYMYFVVLLKKKWFPAQWDLLKFVKINKIVKSHILVLLSETLIAWTYNDLWKAPGPCTLSFIVLCVFPGKKQDTWFVVDPQTGEKQTSLSTSSSDSICPSAPLLYIGRTGPNTHTWTFSLL